MMGPIGLKGSGAATALARQRMAAMSRSSRSMSTLRSQSLRFPSQRSQLKSALSGSAPWRMTPVVAGPAGARFNSTASDSITEVVTDSGAKDLGDIYDITTIPERIGYLKELGLDFGWGFSSTMQYLIEHIHIYTGMPWWASIVTLGLLTRLAMLGPVIGASENSARMAKASTKLGPARQRMIALSREGNTQEAQLARAEMQEIQAAHGISTWKTFFPMLQIPLGFGTFRVVRAMTTLPVPALTSESVAWLTDVTIADPTYILPMISAGALFLSLRKGGESGAMPMMQSEVGKYIVYGFPAISFVFMAFMPGALQLYFASTGIFGLGQTYLINSERFRTMMNMSIAPKVTVGPEFSELTKNTQSKNLRRLLERIEQEKALQAQKALGSRKIPQEIGEIEAPGKISFIDRLYKKFGTVGTDLNKSMSKALGTSSPEERLAQDKKKRASEYEEQRREEDELMRQQRNEARFKAHLQAQEAQRERAKKSLKEARGPRSRRG